MLCYDDELRGTCVYCGNPCSPDLGRGDHVVPLFAMKEMIRLDPKIQSEVVPSCTQCNSIAGSLLFPSFRRKKEYIQDKYFVKFREMAYHSPEEIAESGYNLQQILKKHNAGRQRLLERSQYNPGYAGENHIHNKKLKKFFQSYAHIRDEGDKRTLFPNYVTPERLSRPWSTAREVTELLSVNRKDLNAIINAYDINYTLVGNGYQFSNSEVIEYKIKLFNGDADLKSVYATAKKNRQRKIRGFAG